MQKKGNGRSQGLPYPVVNCDFIETLDESINTKDDAATAYALEVDLEKMDFGKSNASIFPVFKATEKIPVSGYPDYMKNTRPTKIHPVNNMLWS